MKGFAAMKDGSLQRVEIPIPSITSYQALVKMKACGVCNGTDSKLAHHNFKNFDIYPALLGHEGVGEVITLGDKVKKYQLGDRVLLPFIEKELGGYASGWGAYCEYAVVGDETALEEDHLEFPESYLAQQIVPEWMSDVDASMVVTFREVLSATKRFDFKPNESVVIFGAGPVGLSFIKFAKLLGLSTVISIDISDEKVERAKSFGADIGINSSTTDVGKAIKELLPQGVDCVIDAVGINSLVNLSMELIKDNGRICCYGISPTLQMNLDWSKAPYNWSLHFVQWPSKKEESEAHAQILSWIELGVLKPSEFISHIFQFEDIHKAFELIENKQTDMKTVIVYD